MEVKTLSRLVVPALSLTLVAGCALGPDFESPKVPEAANYTAGAVVPPTASANVAAGTAQRFSVGAEIPAEWWTLFHSAALDNLIRRSLAANPDLQAAEAALRQAQEQAKAEGGILFPTVTGQINDSRSQQTGVALGLPANYTSIYSLANAQVSVSYALDIFGGERRAIEAAEATAHYQEFQLHGAYLSLTANLVTAAIQEASLRGQVDATKEIVADQEHQLKVVQQQLSLGGASRADVLAQQATLAQTQATLPTLEKQLAQLRNQLPRCREISPIRNWRRLSRWRRLSCRPICPSACRPIWFVNDRTCARPKNNCIVPAPSLGWRRPISFRNSR